MLYQWSQTPATNATAATSINWAEGQAPSTVNDSARQMMADIAVYMADPQFYNRGHTPTYVSATQFTLVGDQTAAYTVNRRVKCTVTAGTVYGYISVSAFTTLTTITVVLDSGALDAGLSAVALSILSPLSQSVPQSYVTFPSGTRLAFNQAAAPTGWTQDTTAGLNDSALRIVTGAGGGSGGSVAFSTALVNANTTAGYALQIADIPSHSHAIACNANNGTAGTVAVYSSNTAATYNNTTLANGGGGSHAHGLTLGVKYNDFILCQKA